MWMNGRLLLLVLFSLISTATAEDSKSDGQVDDESLSTLFLAPKKAKSILRVKRGWIQKITGEEEEEKEESRSEERRREAVRRHQAFCRSHCWGAYGPYGTCSVPCGSTGVKKSYRSVSPPSKCVSYINSKGCAGSNVRTAACNRSCRNGGTLRPTDCKCPLGYRGRCCEIRVTCDFPGQPANGQVKPRGSKHDYNAVVKFTCNTGYKLIGHQSRQCQQSGKWSNSVPTCQIINCGDPGTPNHGTRHGTQTVYNSVMVYSCETGYNMTGSKSIKCLSSGKWDAGKPVCNVITCSRPPAPQRGNVNIRNGLTFGKKIEYTCNTGTYMVGSSERTCQLNGQWDGSQPKCKVISCSNPGTPVHGKVIFSNPTLTHGTTATFSCDSGYKLHNSRQRICTGSGPLGSWTGSQPSCKPVDCGNPGIPANGVKQGSTYTFPAKVMYQCQPGYYLKGEKFLRCLAKQKWSASRPTCLACAKNYYKIGVNSETTCSKCPEHTHTTVTAAGRQEMCVCNTGYKKNQVGVCTLIRCRIPKVPRNGRRVQCKNRLNEKCMFECLDGYIVDGGNSMRTCQLNGEFDGNEPVCIPCPKDSYKKASSMCKPCPKNSHTKRAASMRENCTCDPGYEKKPSTDMCVDKNECAVNKGRGPCQQRCFNANGTFSCGCYNYYRMDDVNKLRCVLENQCRNLTKKDMPINGGMVCHHHRVENSKQCTVKCNEGYEFPSDRNNYDVCGPSTGYTWTFDSEGGRKVVLCIKEFYPGFKMKAKSAYFVRACPDLSQKEKQEAKESLKKLLTDANVCSRSGAKVCNIKDMEIICGATVARRRNKRGVLEDITSVDFKFDVDAYKMEDSPVVCKTKICPMLSVPSAYCQTHCSPIYRQFLRASVIWAKKRLTDIYAQKNKDNMKFNMTKSDREFVPQEKAVTTSDVIVQCDPGMEASGDICVPCTKGYFYNATCKGCQKCPVGKFQPQEGKEACHPCPSGTYSTKPGSELCPPCKPGFYGNECKSPCKCVHGKCDRRTGQCTCKSGWEGRNCDIDTPGCKRGPCFHRVKCTDIPAPGMGFRCGPCPRGYAGNGANCFKQGS